MLDGAVELCVIGVRSRARRVLVVVRGIIIRNPRFVVAFLPIPSLICELSKLVRRRFVLVVSERSWNPRKRFEAIRFWFHRMADSVVSNSYAQCERIRSVSPALGAKAVVIPNAIDLDKFRPAGTQEFGDVASLRILVLARVVEEKNPIGLLRAVAEIRRRYEHYDVCVDWYGARSSVGWRLFGPNRQAYCELLCRSIVELDMSGKFRLHSARADVLTLYHQCDVACLPSFAEGCSNFICEAMGCGVPILASDVSDNGRLVRDGHNGFLFDPKSEEDMVAAIVRFVELPAHRRLDMALESRRMAASMLSPKSYIDKYERLLHRLESEGRKGD